VWCYHLLFRDICAQYVCVRIDPFTTSTVCRYRCTVCVLYVCMLSVCRHHALKYQGITLPCGILADVYGPVEGRRHDAAIFWESGLPMSLQLLVDAGGNPYLIYADAAYPLLPHLIKGFNNAPVGSPQALFNMLMSRTRMNNEWGFNLITNSFSAVDFTRWQRIYATSPGALYQLAALLTNCLTCIRGGNQISDYFDCAPPSLTDYLAGNW
jgi:hypothetical protein